MRRSAKGHEMRQNRSEERELFYKANPHKRPGNRDINDRNKINQEIFQSSEISLPITNSIESDGKLQAEEIAAAGVEEQMPKVGTEAYKIEMMRRDNEAKIRELKGEVSPPITKPGGKERI